MTHPACPLCGRNRPNYWAVSPDTAHYFRCATCTLVWREPGERLSESAERARYELHENDPADDEYVRFLRRLADPVMGRLRPGARGLDFGSGPAPVLAQLLASQGYPCAAYDPFFAADETLLNAKYDFVTCCEVVEHAHHPSRIFATLRALLLPGSVLGVMTRFYPDQAAFVDWWYRRDPTHVCFYAESTMRWIGEQHGWTTEFPAENVTLFTPRS